MSKISRMLSGVRPLRYRARASAFVTVPEGTQDASGP
jgi:hypothetical protein